MLRVAPLLQPVGAAGFAHGRVRPKTALTSESGAAAPFDVQRPDIRCAAETQTQQELYQKSLTACEISGNKTDCYLMADDIAAGQSFRQAFNNSAPPIIPEDLEGIQLNGIQQFAAAIWDRQRNIPAQGRKNPLDRIFDSFDADRDGHLSPAEVASALRSRGVDLTEEIARKFVVASDADNNDTVERGEFAALIVHMASADLRNKQLLEHNEASLQMCDGDCEIIWDSETGEPIMPTAPHCQPQ